MREHLSVGLALQFGGAEVNTMSDYEPNNQSIATVEQFQKALLRLRDDKLQPLDLPIFKAFCDAPGHTLTATKLAEVCGLSAWNAANLSFGKLARRIGEALHYRPTKRANGTTRWWESAATGSETEGSEDGNYQWTLRPELVECLRKMRWV